MRLINADVCRDGGSIAADFRLGNGSILSLLLEVSPEGWPKYAHLHAGNTVQSTFDPNTVVAKGGRQEKEIISLLTNWRDLPPLEPDEYPMETADKQAAVRWALELCRRIGERTG